MTLAQAQRECATLLERAAARTARLSAKELRRERAAASRRAGAAGGAGGGAGAAACGVMRTSDERFATNRSMILTITSASFCGSWRTVCVSLITSAPMTVTPSASIAARSGSTGTCPPCA